MPRVNSLAEADRVWIVGGPGCGKSTLARELAERRGIEPVTLDAFFWGPDWTPVPTEEFLAHVDGELAADRWIVDGQFAASVEAFAHRADCVVWTDPPLRVTWPRLLRRTLRRWIRREELWGGVRETLWTVIGPRSILWYAVKVRVSQRLANQELFDQLRGTDVLLLHTRDSDVRSLLE
ncbi:adenylate kinase [Streptomyces cahuitamycinicus]|uniref:adenylate kinase n=1 Tax=Streptomyces cahuitamycinicus TaxID=2070367 RepID=UPI0011AF725E|nr:adenylate kinase [Streptomyces cahuitamycinicus]